MNLNIKKILTFSNKKKWMHEISFKKIKLLKFIWNWVFFLLFNLWGCISKVHIKHWKSNPNIKYNPIKLKLKLNWKNHKQVKPLVKLKIDS